MYWKEFANAICRHSAHIQSNYSIVYLLVKTTYLPSCTYMYAYGAKPVGSHRLLVSKSAHTHTVV